MLGTLDLRHREVTVVGAGVAGLLAAYSLHQAGWRVTLIEAANRAGGLISTRRLENGIAESAAHSILQSDAVKELFEELSLKTVAVRKNAKARYILRDGQMRKLPLSIWELFTLLRKLALNRNLLTTPTEQKNQSLEAWGQTHLGTAAVDYLLAPFLIGIYGATPQEISVQGAFPKLAVGPGQTLLGSLLKGRQDGREKNQKRPEMVSIEGGMGQLVEALSTRLRAELGERFSLGQSLNKLPDAANVILSVPAPEAARLLSQRDDGTSKFLKEVKYAPLVTCTVFLKNENHLAPRGVGVLIPPKENRPVLGVLFNSSAFSGRSQNELAVASYTVMLGGTLHPEMAFKPDAFIADLVQKELESLFMLKGPIDEIQITKWPQAVPIYSAELVNAWSEIKTRLAPKPGLALFGNYTGQVSLRGMIEKARELRALK